MAQSTSNTGSTLNGLFRQVYAKEVKDAIPEYALLQKRVPFSKGELLGDYFHIPVTLADEHGFTYGGSTAANYTLNNAVSMILQDAQVRGSELTLQSGISYGAVSRAQNRGSQAVEQSVRLLMTRMKASAAKRVEAQMLYGQTGLGKVSAYSGSSTTRAYTISDATWAVGLWAGMENANLDFYNGASKLNTNAAVVVVSIDVANKKINVSGNATDLTSIDGATAPDIYFYGAYSNEMIGIDKILTTSGSIFNIDNSVYALWAAQTHDCGSAELSMAKILSGLAKPVGRGLMEDVQVLCAPDSWANLMSDLAAQRKFDGSYSKKKAENGAEAIEFYGQNGTIEIISHPMVKGGEAFALPLEGMIRVGSTDVAFRGEGPSGQEEYLFQNTSTNGWTCRAYTDQAIIHTAPAHCVKFTGIVPT